MLAVGDVWDNQVFFDALSEGTLHSAIAVTRKLMSTSKSACRSNMLYALALHLHRQTATRNCTPVLTSRICGILFVLRRFQKQCAFAYAAVFERLMAQMPYMYTPDTHACMRGPLHAYARQQYKDARAFHTVLRELEAGCQCETMREVRPACFHLICKSVVVLDGKHHILLDFAEQSPALQARFCEAMCANLHNIAKGSNLEIGVLCALEAVASVAFSGVIFYTLFHEFSLAVCVRDSFRVQMLHGSLARSLSSTNDAIGVQQYVLDNDLLGHALLLYHAHCAVRDEGLHIAMCSLLWQLVTTQRRMLPAQFEQMLQVRVPLTHTPTSSAHAFGTNSNNALARATAQIFGSMDPTLGWPATVMLMVLRLVTSNYKCYFTSTTDALALVLAVKNVCMQSHDACVLADGVELLRTVDEESMLDESMLTHVEPVLHAFTQATLALHAPEPTARGLPECGHLYARIVKHADRVNMQRVAPDVLAFLRLALSNSARAPWRMNCRHLDLCVRMCRGVNTCEQALVASLVTTLARCAQSIATHLHECSTRLVSALISAVVFIGSQTPLDASAEVGSFRVLLAQLACCRHSQASVHRVYRLFVVSCPTHMCINQLEFKETLVTRLVACRVNKASAVLQISSMLLTVHTCNHNSCLCSNFTPGTCQRVLKWCLWGILHTRLSPAAAYNIFSMLGVITRSAAAGRHRRCTAHQVAADVRAILTHTDAAVLSKHNIVPVHTAQL